MTRYGIPRGRAIKAGPGRGPDSLLSGPMEIDVSMLKEGQLESGLKSGFIVELDSMFQSRLGQPDENQPVVGGPSRGKKIKSKARFDEDPANIEGLTLQQLNVMIAERSDKRITAFETKDEAIAFLSQDFSK